MLLSIWLKHWKLNKEIWRFFYSKKFLLTAIEKLIDTLLFSSNCFLLIISLFGETPPVKNKRLGWAGLDWTGLCLAGSSTSPALLGLRTTGLLGYRSFPSVAAQSSQRCTPPTVAQIFVASRVKGIDA